MAHGLLDPWDDLTMDTTLLPRIEHGFGCATSTKLIVFLYAIHCNSLI